MPKSSTVSLLSFAGVAKYDGTSVDDRSRIKHEEDLEKEKPVVLKK